MVQPDAHVGERRRRAPRGCSGEFHWHKHDDTDEFFLVLDGELLIDLEDGETVTLRPQQGFTVPRTLVHRTRSPQRTSILMVEAAGVVPTGDD